jgi:hypothetical protein
MFQDTWEHVGTSFNFWGAGPKRKQLLKAGPTLFLGFDGRHFHEVCQRVTANIFVKSNFPQT